MIIDRIIVTEDEARESYIREGLWVPVNLREPEDVACGIMIALGGTILVAMLVWMVWGAVL